LAHGRSHFALDGIGLGKVCGKPLRHAFLVVWKQMCDYGRMGPLVNRSRMLAGFCLAALMPAAFAQIEYHLTMLPTQPYFSPSVGGRILASGDILLRCSTNGGSAVATISSGGQVQFAGLGQPTGMNSLREVCVNTGVATVWRPGSTTYLSSLAGDDQSQASDINEAGVVAGWSGVSSSRPVAWVNGEAMQLPGVNGTQVGVANAVNNSGRIVGRAGSLSQSTLSRAVYWDDGVVHEIPSLPAWRYSRGATAISDSGDIVGWAEINHSTSDENAPGWYRAFLYRNGVTQDLGTLSGGSSATAVNNHGVVIGTTNLSLFAFPVAGTPFIWSNGTMRYLAPLVDAIPEGMVLGRVASINDDGWISGTLYETGNTSSGATHAVLLTPVPEPLSAITLLSLSVLALARRTRLR
jgi:probable HAF family extracellular repeat protein